jgi:hypothetical protein
MEPSQLANIQVPRLVELGTICGLIIITALINFGKWIERQLREAEFRNWKRVWDEECSLHIAKPQHDWPQAGKATRTFFNTNTGDLPLYDPAADAANYIEKLDRDTQDYLEEMQHREH